MLCTDGLQALAFRARIWIASLALLESAGKPSLTMQQQVATLNRMRAVEIRVLNSRLSEHMRMAAAGETILVTDRGHVLAEIGPSRETPSPVLEDAVLAEGVRKGWLTPPALR